MQLLSEATKPKESMSAAWGRKLLLLLVSLLAVQTAVADHGKVNSNGNAPHAKLSKELQNFKGSNAVDVIVQLRVKPATANYNFLAASGGKFRNKKALRHVNSLALRLSPQALTVLEANRDIVYVSADRRVKRAADVA